MFDKLKLATRSTHKKDTIIDVKGVKIGNSHFTVIAGPCAVESEIQVLETAKGVKENGAVMLRGGAFKPRTNPYSFQGLGEKGLKILKKAREETGLPVVTEVMDPRYVLLVAEYSDILQIGARNMQNYSLLKEVGKQEKPVILKRGLANSVEEWLGCAEYIMNEGNHNVILCERGIRTFETATRFTLDLGIIPIVKKYSHLPIIVDPSHAQGNSEFIAPLCRAAKAVGADGLIVEVHYHPEEAQCDKEQALSIEQFKKMMESL